MTSFTRLPARLLAAMGALVALAACGSTPTSPGVQPQVSNLTDSFSYQVSNVQNFTGTQSYSWQNTGTGASIDQATTVGKGSATLILLDDAGTQVYSRALSDNGSFPTTSGVSGTWTIQVVYNGADATVNFRAQKATP